MTIRKLLSTHIFLNYLSNYPGGLEGGVGEKEGQVEPEYDFKIWFFEKTVTFTIVSDQCRKMQSVQTS